MVCLLDFGCGIPNKLLVGSKSSGRSDIFVEDETTHQEGAIRKVVGWLDHPCAAKHYLRKACYYICLNTNMLQDIQNDWFWNILSTNPMANLNPPTIADLRRSGKLISLIIFWLRRLSWGNLSSTNISRLWCFDRVENEIWFLVVIMVLEIWPDLLKANIQHITYLTNYNPQKSTAKGGIVFRSLLQKTVCGAPSLHAPLHYFCNSF